MFYSHNNANTEYLPNQGYSITVSEEWGMGQDENVCWGQQQEERYKSLSPIRVANQITANIEKVRHSISSMLI